MSENDESAPVRIGVLAPGPLNTITDVLGVRVGHTTIVYDSPTVARTGVTAIFPTECDYSELSVFAGFHRLNGFGEVCGTHWLAESGVLSSPVLLTSTLSVGVCRDTLLADPMRRGIAQRFHHPLVAEANDAFMSDGLAAPIEPEHVLAAMRNARTGPVQQGNVGAGTGMVSFGFKGGIGSASRTARTRCGAFTVGALVQANLGLRHELIIDGVAVGRLLDRQTVARSTTRPIEGSIVVVLATDAPLLPSQCTRMAQRAVIGLGRSGSNASNASGEFVIAFATGNRLPALNSANLVRGLSMFPNEHLNELFDASIEAVQAAVLHALWYAETMRGREGRIVHALPHDAVRAILREAAARVT